MKPLTGLDDFGVVELSTVNKGANRKGRFPIFKKENNGMDEKIIKAVLETQVDEEAALDSIVENTPDIDDDTVSVLKAATRILAGFRDKLPSEALVTLAKVTGLDEPKLVTKSEEGSDMTSQFEEITKAQKVEIDALKKALEEQKDTRDRDIWRSRVEKHLAYYPGKSVDEMTDQLHKISKTDSAMAESLFDSMKSAAESLKQGNLFKSAGDNNPMGANDNDAWVQIKKLAGSVIEKSGDVTMTEAQAINKVLFTERGRALYSQYLDEHPRQTGEVR